VLQMIELRQEQSLVIDRDDNFSGAYTDCICEGSL